jgi:hypothetical protein
MKRRLLWIPVLWFAACNSTMQGDPAPKLPTIGWLAPAGPDARVETEGKWVLLEFFSPT